MNAEEFIRGFKELRSKTPKISVTGYQNHNCPFGNAIYNSKNCYLCFDMDSSEGCLYCGMVTRARFCCDCEDIWDSELCYECHEVYNCYNCDFSLFLRDSSDCSYCYDLLACHNCFGCAGLRRANYFIFNQRFSPEDYQKCVAELKSMPKSALESCLAEIRLKFPHNGNRQYRTENCFGDNIQNSKNVFYAFNTKSVNEGAYLYDIYNVYGERNEDVYDSFFSVDLFHCFQCVQVGDGWNTNYSHYCEHIKECEFCEGCFNSHNLFGCHYINRKEFLILNKQYNKEEWHKETSKLKEQLKSEGKYGWGLFGD